MVGAANARRPIGERARLGLGQGHHFSQIAGWRLGVEGQVQRRARSQRDGHKVTLVVVAQVLVDHGIDGEGRAIGHHEGVAIFGGRGQGLCSHHAVGTGLVVDHHRLAQTLGQLLCIDPRHGVGQAARRVGDDELDGFGRIGLRPSAASLQGQQRKHNPSGQACLSANQRSGAHVSLLRIEGGQRGPWQLRAGRGLGPQAFKHTC